MAVSIMAAPPVVQCKHTLGLVALTLLLPRSESMLRRDVRPVQKKALLLVDAFYEAAEGLVIRRAFCSICDLPFINNHDVKSPR